MSHVPSESAAPIVGEVTIVGWPDDTAAKVATAGGWNHVPASELDDPARRRRLRHDSVVIWVDEATTSPTPERTQRLAQLTTAAHLIIPVPADQISTESVAARIRAAWSRAVREGDGAQSNPGSLDQTVTETVTFADGRSYPIVIGRGVVDGLGDHIPERAARVAIITQAGIDQIPDTGRDQRVFMVEDGEQAKRLEVVADLASQFAQWGMTRADVVVAVGGGVVTDLGAFVASTYHRGIPVIHVATTLLGQIDAAIGGKCGVNLPEGKNLVGSFWQPTAVLCEIDSLDTLPRREFLSGMGELAKYHFLGGGELDRFNLVNRVAASARIKAEVVSGDEREGGRRAILNYGHTLAHALETASGYDELRHGEAVAIGLIYAAEVARRLGRIDTDRVAEHRRVVSAYGLSTKVPPGFDPGELVDLFSRDKKAIDGVTFVLDGPEGVEPVRVDDRDLLLDALDAVWEGTGG